ncbi:MAG: type VI secretion system tip protein VgrG [Myxococcales bacterium]|nr:type VI secretion system tip protein VgrG [Myxococcales bacterium]
MTSFAIASDVVPSTASVAGFQGVDALSEPFCFDIYFVLTGSATVDIEGAVFSAATLSISRDGPLSLTAPHTYSGIFSEMELVAAVPGNALYRARLVPRFWLLGLSQHSRIFTKRTVRDVITEVLGEYGLSEGADFELRISGGQTEEHICQYKESDFAFLSRWMAREGFTYFFLHEGGKDKLVITDEPTGHPSLRTSPVRYFPGAGKDGSYEQAFSELTCNLVAQPARVTVRDYDYAKPTSPLRSAVDVSASSVGVYDDYGARVFTGGDAERIALVRAKRLKCRERTFSARGSATHLSAGTTFELDLHPRADFNVAYLVTRITHLGREPHLVAAWGDLSDLQGQSLSDTNAYEIELEAVTADVPWKALETIAWPHVDSFENAIVDGPADSQYAQIDDQGRYAVKFHFDEGTLKDGKASTRVRMMQPHGGTIEGFHFPLRKGTEVICAFLGGDVDRPFIQAVAPNAEKPSPVVAANRSQNILQTGSATYLTIEDQAGSEFINVFTPKERSGLYLGVGRGEGGRALTSNAAPAVPPAGPGGLKLGPFSFDLRTDTGHAQLYTGQSLDIHAHGQLQRIAGSDVNVTMFGALDHDVVGEADEYYHQTLEKSVALKVTARHDDTRDFTVHFAALEKYDAVFDKHTVGPAIFTFLTGCDREITDGLTDYHYFSNQQRTITNGYKVDLSPKNELIVHGDMIQTVTGGKTEHVTESLDIEIGGNVNIVHNAPNVNTLAGPEVEEKKGMVIEASLLGKLDVVSGTHKEAWSFSHIEVTAGLLGSIFFPLVFETGVSANISYTHIKAELVGMDFSFGAAAIVVEGQATELDPGQVQLGLFTLTTKGFKLM